jgi:hypothetical protein
VDDRELSQLLRNADAAIETPASGDLIAGAMRLHSRRRSRMVALSCVAMIAAGMALCPLRPIAGPPIQTPDFKMEIANLDFQDQLASRTLDELRKSEMRLAVDQHLRRLEDRAGDLRQDREETATVLLEGAADSSDSTVTYRQVAKYFPETGAGIVARQQLASE